MAAPPTKKYKVQQQATNLMPARQTKPILFLDVDGVINSYFWGFLDDEELRKVLGKPTSERPSLLPKGPELVHRVLTGSSEGSRCPRTCYSFCQCSQEEYVKKTPVTFPHELFATSSEEWKARADKLKGYAIQKVAVNTFWVLYNPVITSRLATLLKSGVVEGQWCTSWRENAVQHLGPALGFPQDMPDSLPEDQSFFDSKPRTVERIDSKRPLIWIDDDIRGCNWCDLPWLREREGPTLAIAPLRLPGLQEWHVDEVEKFCRDPVAYHAEHGVRIIDEEIVAKEKEAREESETKKKEEPEGDDDNTKNNKVAMMGTKEKEDCDSDTKKEAGATAAAAAAAAAAAKGDNDNHDKANDEQ